MGDITSGDVKDDAAANVDFGGGGGQDDYYSASQNIPTSAPSTPASLGFGGAKGDIVARTPTSVPTVSPPMSPFQLGFGGAQKVPNYMDDLNTLMGGGGSSADASAVSVDDRPRPDPNEIANAIQLGGGDRTPPNPNEIADTVQIGGGDRRPPGLDMPEFNARTPDEIGMTPAYNVLKNMDFPGSGVFAPGIDPIGPGLGLIDNPDLAKAIANPQGTLPSQIGDNLFANKVFSLGKGTTEPKTQEDLNLLQRLGRFLKGLGKSISNFEMNDIFEFLKGDPNFTGPSPAQQDLMGVPGPGPAVGGGMPSPSGTGSDMPVTTMPETPAETVIKKDPCPPGFKLDPILNQCMPIVKAAPTPPPMPTLPQPTAPTGGGIANVYPFTLTPPVGAPVGTVAPIRFTPK